MVAESETVVNDSSALPSATVGGRGPTLPSGPKSGIMALRKPPSLSTLAMPSFTGMRPPSQTLLDTLGLLIKRLPEENRDLLRTVTELIRATAKESKETKMPLSNLLLVFCPSLNMNPPLLRVLCEGQGIWDCASPEPEIVMDISCDVVYGDSMEPHAAYDEELTIGSTDPQSSSNSTLASVDSFASAEEEQGLSGLASLSEPYTRNTPPPLSISAESLVSTVSSGEPSISDIAQAGNTPHKAVDDAPPFSMNSVDLTYIPDPVPVVVHRRPLPRRPLPQRPTISAPILSEPVVFPISSNQPPTPISPRMSVPSLSLPSFNLKQHPYNDSKDPAPSSPGSLRDMGRKRDKPSLQRLFARRSTSTLNSLNFPAISPPIESRSGNGSNSSLATPISAHSTYTLPPMSIETSPMQMGMGISLDTDGASDTAPASISVNKGVVIDNSQASLNSNVGSCQAEETRSHGPYSSANASSRLDLFADEEDWTKSVLLAADFDISSLSA